MIGTPTAVPTTDPVIQKACARECSPAGNQRLVSALLTGHMLPSATPSRNRAIISSSKVLAWDM
ncbi:hypothetical protein D3C83_106030 [compost metagenome]